MYKTNKKFLFEEKNVKILDLIKSSKIIDNEDRISFSENYLKWKRILNIGCLNHDMHSYNQQHDDIKNLWKLIVGVDIIPEAKNLWWDIVIGDICDNRVSEKILDKFWTFDVVFAWELIEHLDNYKAFFENIYSVLNNDGVVIVSTPNPFWLHYQLQNLFYWYMPEWNTDHTCRIDIIQLAFNIQEKFFLIDFSRLNNTKSMEHTVIKILWKKQLSFNYLAVFQKHI